MARTTRASQSWWERPVAAKEPVVEPGGYGPGYGIDWDALADFFAPAGRWFGEQWDPGALATPRLGSYAGPPVQGPVEAERVAWAIRQGLTPPQAAQEFAPTGAGYGGGLYAGPVPGWARYPPYGFETRPQATTGGGGYGGLSQPQQVIADRALSRGASYAQAIAEATAGVGGGGGELPPWVNDPRAAQSLYPQMPGAGTMQPTPTAPAPGPARTPSREFGLASYATPQWWDAFTDVHGVTPAEWYGQDDKRYPGMTWQQSADEDAAWAQAILNRNIGAGVGATGPSPGEWQQHYWHMKRVPERRQYFRPQPSAQRPLQRPLGMEPLERAERTW